VAAWEGVVCGGLAEHCTQKQWDAYGSNLYTCEAHLRSGPCCFYCFISFFRLLMDCFALDIALFDCGLFILFPPFSPMWKLAGISCESVLSCRRDWEMVCSYYQSLFFSLFSSCAYFGFPQKVSAAFIVLNWWWVTEKHLPHFPLVQCYSPKLPRSSARPPWCFLRVFSSVLGSLLY